MKLFSLFISIAALSTVQANEDPDRNDLTRDHARVEAREYSPLHYSKAQCIEEHDGRESFPCGDGCNQCSCGSTGLISTAKLCTRPQRPGGPAEYSQKECIQEHGAATWTCADGCNICSCGPNGLTSTLMLCPRPRDATRADGLDGYSQKKCIQEHGGRKSFKCADGCNTCSCGPNGMFSTLMGCSRRSDTPHSDGPDGYSQEKCIQEHGGESWTCADKCNICFCGATAIGSTLKACVTLPTPPKSSPSPYKG